MSASSDNQLVIYSIHGEILKTLELKLNILYEARISPCGRFVAASGFTPDVFVFEVRFICFFLWILLGVLSDFKKKIFPNFSGINFSISVNNNGLDLTFQAVLTKSNPRKSYQ